MGCAIDDFFAQFSLGATFVLCRLPHFHAILCFCRYASVYQMTDNTKPVSPHSIHMQVVNKLWKKIGSDHKEYITKALTLILIGCTQRSSKLNVNVARRLSQCDRIRWVARIRFQRYIAKLLAFPLNKRMCLNDFFLCYWQQISAP